MWCDIGSGKSKGKVFAGNCGKGVWKRKGIFYAKCLKRPLYFRWNSWKSFFKASISEGVNGREREDVSGFSFGEGFKASGDVVFPEESFGFFTTVFPFDRLDGAGFNSDDGGFPGADRLNEFDRGDIVAEFLLGAAFAEAVLVGDVIVVYTASSSLLATSSAMSSGIPDSSSACFR